VKTEPTRAKRKKTARELAERFGVHPSTIRRTVAQSREDYLSEAAERHARIHALRAQGLSMRAIAEREGITPGAVHYAIHKDN
jgi:transposase